MFGLRGLELLAPGAIYTIFFIPSDQRGVLDQHGAVRTSGNRVLIVGNRSSCRCGQSLRFHRLFLLCRPFGRVVAQPAGGMPSNGLSKIITYMGKISISDKFLFIVKKYMRYPAWLRRWHASHMPSTCTVVRTTLNLSTADVGGTRRSNFLSSKSKILLHRMQTR
jgi:hypothetical protein